MPTPDVRLDLKVRNNLLLKRMEAAGYYSVSSLAAAMRETGSRTSNSRIGELVNMKVLPEAKRGGWLKTVIEVAKFLRCLPEDLFSDPQRMITLRSNRASAEIAYAAFEQISVAPSPEKLMLRAEISDVLAKVMTNRLNHRQQDILRLRFGFDGEPQTLDEIGKKYNLQKETIRQIEAKALRRLERCTWQSDHPDYMPDAEEWLEELNADPR